MLFAQLNGQGPARPVEDSTEADVVQRVACDFGPRVEGIAASRSLPQSMGAFVTYGAQGACVGRAQQSEQHSSTTVRSMFGQAAAVGPSIQTAPTPTPTTTTFPSRYTALISKVQSMSVTTPPPPTTTPPPDGSQCDPSTQYWDPGTQTCLPFSASPSAAPSSAAPTTFPSGTVTAYSSTNGMWRVAVPPAPGATLFTEVLAVSTPPAGATQIPESDFNTKIGKVPFYKKPWFWAIIGGSVIVIGGGALLIRRRRKVASPAPAAAPSAR